MQEINFGPKSKIVEFPDAENWIIDSLIISDFIKAMLKYVYLRI